MHADTIVTPVLLEGVKIIGDWYRSSSNIYLQSIFNLTGFSERNNGRPIYYTPPLSLTSTIPYPSHDNLSIFEDNKKKVLSDINTYFNGLSESYLSSLNSNQLLYLLEKFGGNIPFKEDGIDAVYDIYKIKAARHLIKWNQENLGHQGVLFVNIDISGIQTFIYNIISRGALKNLRARSFFIELLTCHIIRQILDVFHLHSVNVLMDGGGSIYIISSCPPNYQELLYEEISYKLNKWLLENLGGKLYSVFSGITCSNNELDMNLSGLFTKLNNQTFTNKRSKYKTLIEMGHFPFVNDIDPAYPDCQICHRDDPGAGIRQIGETDAYVCNICYQLINIGNRIPTANYIYSSPVFTQGCLQIQDDYYLLANELREDLICLWLFNREDNDFVLRIKKGARPVMNNQYTTRNCDLQDSIRININEKMNILIKECSSASDNEQKRLIEEEIDSLRDGSMASVEYLAESSDGAKLVGALRMDADNVGKLIHEGFYGEDSLTKVSSFSRNINYFFKSHLMTLCENKTNRILSFRKETMKRRNIQVIYAGGDDLFLVGAWSDVAELAVDLGNTFRDYTCGNLDIGLSGGLTLHHPQFPISKMAEETKLALSAAKENKLPCYMCRKNWLGCPLYDGGECLRKDSLALFFTSHMASFKRNIEDKQYLQKYQHESVRLKLAVKWKLYDSSKEEIVNEVDDCVVKPLAAFVAGQGKLGKGFFQNALSLLNIWYDEGVLYLPGIVWMLQKFRNELRRMSIHADSQVSLLEMYLHLNDKERFATLHLPLWWSILLGKGEKTNDYKINGREAL